MKWFVSKDVDNNDVEFQERMNFYSTLRRRGLFRNNDLELKLDNLCYIFNDGHIDNRYMFIGHTHFATGMVRGLKSQRNRENRYHKFFICSCIDSFEYFYKAGNLEMGDEVYVSIQKLEEIEGCNRYTCEFLRKEVTRLGFKATKSEMSLLNSEIESFYGNLKHCFIPLQHYKNVEGLDD